MNTDQGSQYTSDRFTQTLKDRELQISMDGKGAWRDNIFVERLWRSIKYEDIYLHAYETPTDVKHGCNSILNSIILDALIEHIQGKHRIRRIVPNYQ